MTPMFFGASESPLFGLLHEPEGEAKGHGVLLCPPGGQEHVRTHWAFRQLALALSRAGFPCFRFDWSGVGDSSGDLRTATLARWKDDAIQAAQELRDAAGVRKVSVVGLRLGGAVAALAAAQIKPTCLVLWDPVLVGSRYLADQRRIQRELLASDRRYWRPKAREPRPTEILGFEIGEELLAEIEQIEMASVARLPKVRVCLLRSSLSTELLELGELLRARKLEVELHTTEMWAQWSSAAEIEELLLPADSVRKITDYLGRRAT